MSWFLLSSAWLLLALVLPLWPMVYKLVQIAVRAAEKLGATGAIEKADKKKYVMEALEHLGVKITPTIETMIEAAVKEMDIQNDKIKDELKKN